MIPNEGMGIAEKQLRLKLVKNYFKLLYSHVNDPPTPLRKYLPLADENIEHIVMKCLEKKSEDRYQDISQLISEIMGLYTQDEIPTLRQLRKKVLFADDNRMIAKTIGKMFSKLGLQPIVCHDGEKAVELAFKEKPDLIWRTAYYNVSNGSMPHPSIRL